MASIASSVNFATIEDPRQQKQTNPMFRFICNNDPNKIDKINEHFDDEIKKIRDKVNEVENRFSELKMTTKQVNANKKMIDNMIKRVDYEVYFLLQKTKLLISRLTPDRSGRVSPSVLHSHRRNNCPGRDELIKIKNALKTIRGRLYSLFLLVDGSKKSHQKMNPDLQRVKKTRYGGRKKKTRKVNKLSLSDYRKILKFYKMKIPNSASKIRKEGNKIIAQKFCSCIKKVRKKFKKEGIAIGICTKSVITRKNIKRGKFKCKKRRTIKLYKGGSKKSKKNKTRKKRGGILFPFFVRDSDTSNINLVLANKPKRKSMYGEPHPWRKFFVDPRDNDDLDEINSIPDGLSFSFPLFSGGQSGKKLTLQEFNERLKKRTQQLRTSPITASIGINPLPKGIRQFTLSPINVPSEGKNKNGGHPRPLISHEDEEYEGGNKSKKIKDIVKIFKQYPDIFPRGYFRYLPATLEKHHKKGTLIYKNGVVLTYTKYKKTVNKYKKYKIKPGDVKLNQLVNKEQGNGEAKKIFLKFMEKHKDSNLLLDVLASNKKAIRFYRKNGFKKIDETKFGDKLKGIVMLKRSKNNRTRKKKN